MASLEGWSFTTKLRPLRDFYYERNLLGLSRGLARFANLLNPCYFGHEPNAAIEYQQNWNSGDPKMSLNTSAATAFAFF